MANDKKNLYKLVTQANKDNPDGVKSRFGYTVDGAYKGSVSVLESAYYDIKTVQVAGGGGIAPAGTFNPSSGLQASEQYSVMSNADGLAIKIEAGSKWTTQYQGLCLVRDYMSFYVSVNGQTEYSHVPIGYQNVKNNDYYGQSLAGKYSFPSYEAGENNKYDRDDYIVGVGLDFDNFVIPYLKKFFNEDGGKWEVNTLRKIGGNLQMFAEILFPKTNLEEDKEGGYKATNYYVIHSPVTFDYHVPSMMGFFILHFPVPLFLVSDFSALGTVNVKKQQKLLKVGGGQIGAPFSSGKYKHKEAKIDGFKYSQYSKVGDTVLKQTKIDHIGSARCFVRIFFDSAAQSELGLNSSLSEQQKKNLFTGAYDANQFIARRVIDGGDGGVDYSITGMTQFLEDLMSQLNNKFPISQLMSAMRSVGLVEAGGTKDNPLQLNWAKFADIQDGQGVSMGGLQCTEKAGGLAKFAKHYRNRAKDIPPDVDAMLNAFAKKTGSSDDIYNTGLQAAYKHTFAKIGNSTQCIMAQMDTWKQEKWEKTRNAYNKYNAQCALEFFCICGGVNHLPNEYENALIDNNVAGIPDKYTRCKYFQACHWESWAKYYTKKGRWSKDKGGNGTATQFLAADGIEKLRKGPSVAGHGQARRFWAVLWNIQNGNFDLTKRLITREKSADFPGAPYLPHGVFTYPNPPKG